MNWGITDGSAGMEAQVRGVLEALGEPFELKRCRRQSPWCWLPGNWYYGALQQLTGDSNRLVMPWPDMIVSSGRRSVAFALAVKAASGGKTKLVHLTDPRIAAQHFDLVVAMAHDPIAGANVVKTEFALHALSREKLSQAAKQFAPLFAAYPAPRVAVLIGGSTNKYTLSADAMQQLLERLAAFQGATQASLLITASRRTGEKNRAMLSSWAQKRDQVYVDNGKGENPYLGLLALSEAIIVTNDSVNMMSEAAFTGKPLYLLPLAGHSDTKPARFAEKLVARGIARWLGVELGEWSYMVPDERAMVVERIRLLLSSPTALGRAEDDNYTTN